MLASMTGSDARQSVLDVAVAQFAPDADRAANLERMRELASDAAGRGAGLVVFPEYSQFFAPKLGPDWAAAAEPLDGPFVTALGQLARELRIAIVAGLAERVDPGPRFSNTIVAIDADGERLTEYRKLHLYDAFGARESDWIVPGDAGQQALFELGGIRVGVQTCYDLRFPEVTRMLVDAGAELVLLPSEWVRGPLKEHHWRTLVTARAIENTVWFAAADHAPPVGVGSSMIVDPMGVAAASLGEQVGVALAPVSADRVAQVRRVNPSLALRRFRVEPC